MNGIVAAKGRLSAGRFHAPQAVAGELVRRSPAQPDDLIGVFPYGEEDVPEATVAASRAARPFSALTLAERADLLGRIRPELLRRLPQLTLLIMRETGRPGWECQREVQGLLGRLDQTVAVMAQRLGDRSIEGLPARVFSRPLGVVAVIGPAMLPLSTSHTHILAALAAGNAVVWKPSPLCPASAQVYAEALHHAGLPAGVFNLVQGDDAVGRALATSPLVDGVVFTGSSTNGLELKRALCERTDLTLVLHMGAKNAAVVMEDADLKAAAYEVAVSAFLSSGQRCTATSRVLVHRRVLDEFLALLLRICRGLAVGAPADRVFMGPMLDGERMERFMSRRDRATEEGAERLLEGERLDLPGWYVSPSIHLVSERRADSVYQQEELFGPDLAVYPVRDFDDALPLCDGTRYGLCAALFSETPMRWKRFSEEIRAGTLFWNCGTHAPSGLLPFGGYRASGQGGRGGADAMLALRHEISLLGRTSESPEPLPGTQEFVETQLGRLEKEES